MSEQLRLDGHGFEGHTAPGNGGVETTFVPTRTPLKYPTEQEPRLFDDEKDIVSALYANLDRSAAVIVKVAGDRL